MKRLVVFAALALAGCASMPSTSNDAESAIRKMDAEFSAAARAGNVDGMMAIYAADAVLMPPNLPAFRGRDAIRQFWSGFLAAGTIDATVAPDTVWQSGDMATELGHYELTITPKGAAPIHDKGKFVLTWKKIDGQWRAAADIFNSDLSAK